MSMVRRSVPFVAGLLLAGCSDNSKDGITQPVARQSAAASLDKGQGDQNRLISSVDGHAAFDVTTLPGLREEYSVNAKRRADGTVFGELELRQQLRGHQYHIHGRMFCLSTADGLARLAVRVEQSDQPDVAVGRYLAWTVRDNDRQDHEFSPDQSTEFFLFDAGPAFQHCTTGNNLAPLFPVKGHLEVRDAATEEGHD